VGFDVVRETEVREATHEVPGADLRQRDWDTWSMDEFDRTNREMDKIIDEFRESGELVDGHGARRAARPQRNGANRNCAHRGTIAE
jgi:hypothetical protein